MALSAENKARLDIAMASKAAADALIAKLEANEALSARELRELEIALCDKKAAAEIASDELAIAEDDQDDVDAAQSDVDDAQADLDAYVAPEAAEATLDLTTDIILTSVAEGAARNTNTFTLQILAAAANTDDEVLVDFTGTSAAIVCTVTPNDGTNNSLTPVDLTTEELAELINTGAVVGKNTVITDGSSFRALQTATGGDATALADAGEGDGEIATFAGGVTEVGDLEALEEALADAQAALAAILALQAEHQVSDRSVDVMEIALTSREAAEELKELIEE